MARAARPARRSLRIQHAHTRPLKRSSSNAGLDVPNKKAKGVTRTTDNGSAKTAERRLADRKYQAWSAHATSSPFPEFAHPTREECESAYRVLDELHGAAVDNEFADPETPETIPHVLDAVVVALLSQATSWSNAKRAMRSMKEVYGSVFAYEEIVQGGLTKLQETIRCGGLHVRKSKLLMGVFEDVRHRQGKWDLDHLFYMTDDEAMKELMSYKGMGPKSASVVLTWCLKRNPFTVDTHIYRIAGLWDWRPKNCTREMTQSHLDAMIPPEMKFRLHFLLIQHGRTCPACRGGSKGGKACIASEKFDQASQRSRS